MRGQMTDEQITLLLKYGLIETTGAKYTYTKEDIGCYVQGGIGDEGTAYRLLDIAKAHGFSYEPAYEGDMEALQWLTIQAEKWMVENTQYPENTRWGWDSNGDFGLWELED